MKKVILIGGAGTIGKILSKGLMNNYQVVIMDKDTKHLESANCIQLDATNYHELITKIPEDADVIINLLKVNTEGPIENKDNFDVMTDVFFKATYYILLVAEKIGISKVIYCSSNHVTDYYEEDGNSLLGREITVNDYPYMKSVYGLLKLASEQAGFLFSQRSLSVLNIRIGSVPPKKEHVAIQEKPRLKKTLLTTDDVIGLFLAAIEADVTYGTYYGVSANPGKPWDTSNLMKELNYQSKRNVMDLLEERKDV
ncbi:NAD-dependent epimerase/dehydratase family protein [Evansella tamaricis]|uniref:NAD(P)-dependent oxidoreductase n=1 Tax=Evansella tamaricis TaxID=2069301 RepID=A0ABS6JGN1_9BACI|nr:NAD(P)-dependent oxidoreductase [Evansella tamaricis]MBU9711620.1 NAD(P)-dependent oxidoreductase [Evansella tamaricis]